MELSGPKYKTFQDDGSDEAEGQGKTRSYTIDEALDHIGLGRAQLKVGLFAGLAWTADGAEMMVLSILGPVLICEWGISRLSEAMITTVVFLGMSIGSYAFGYIADMFGRKTSLLISSIWLLFYGILTAAAPNLVWILILRCAVGVGVGGCPQVITYCSEFLPTKGRGKVLMSLQTFWTIGAMIQVILAILLMPFGWRFWLLSSAFPVAIFVILTKFLTPSPRYLLGQQRNEEAQEALRILATGNGKKPLEGKLLPLVQLPKAELKELFTPEFKRTSILLLFLWFSCGFGYYGLVLLSTDLISKGDTCVAELGASLDNTHCGFSACKPLHLKDYTDILITTAAELPGLIFAMFVIDFIGRKNTFMLLFLIYTLGCLLLNICLSRLPMMVFLFMTRACITTVLQVCFIYVSEVYPTECRALGMGLGSAAARVGAVITPYCAQVLLGVSLHASLGVYAAIGFISVIVVFFLPIETKDKTLAEHHDDSSKF